jgi:two-component system chemotaxis response regulator CheB
VYEIVVVGTSLGGLNALGTILGGLPQAFPLPLVIVQHRGRETHDGLAEFLAGGSALPVTEPRDKQPILPGRAYLAPADYHLLVERGYLTLSTEAPVQFARPSIDVLFESAADSYGSHVIGVVLTGANSDGARGAARILQQGGLVVAQEPTTAESPIMPESAIAQGVRYICPLREIAVFLTSLPPLRHLQGATHERAD